MDEPVTAVGFGGDACEAAIAKPGQIRALEHWLADDGRGSVERHQVVERGLVEDGGGHGKGHQIAVHIRPADGGPAIEDLHGIVVRENGAGRVGRKGGAGCPGRDGKGEGECFREFLEVIADDLDGDHADEVQGARFPHDGGGIRDVIGTRSRGGLNGFVADAERLGRGSVEDKLESHVHEPVGLLDLGIGHRERRGCDPALERFDRVGSGGHWRQKERSFRTRSRKRQGTGVPC